MLERAGERPGRGACSRHGQRRDHDHPRHSRRAPGRKRLAALSEPLARLGPVKIVVTTPTGHVGSRVVQLLLQAGVRPTLLARPPARLDPAVIERADVVQADQADAGAVVRATRDADALFWLAPDTADPDADP